MAKISMQTAQEIVDTVKDVSGYNINFIFFQTENPWSLDRGMNGVTFIYCIFFT